MNEQIKKLQLVKATLESMEIKPSQRNTAMLCGIYQFIDEIVKWMAEQTEDEPAVAEDEL